jgi:hypothetical protein
MSLTFPLPFRVRDLNSVIETIDVAIKSSLSYWNDGILE